MFGNKKLLTDGVQARGVVTGLGWADKAKFGDGVLEFQTHVVFDDGAATDVTFFTSMGDWRDADSSHVGRFGGDVLSPAASAAWRSLEQYLQPGATVPVRYDPAHHKKTVLDLPALRQEVFARSPGASTELAAAPGSGPIADILQQLAQDPEGLRDRARGQAHDTGASAFVVTEAGMAPLGATPPSHRTDVADALGKLADLRDRGVLTDAEFEAEKQKLLNT